MSVKVTASGTGTLTIIAWMAPPAPPPGRSGLRNLMTPATQGIIMHHLQSLFTIDVQNINRSILHLKHSLTSLLGSLTLFQRTFVPHFNTRRLAGHQPGGGQQGHNLRCLLESFLWCSEYLQGLPLWPAEDRLCVQVPRPGVLSVYVCAVSFVTSDNLKQFSFNQHFCCVVTIFQPGTPGGTFPKSLGFILRLHLVRASRKCL